MALDPAKLPKTKARVATSLVLAIKRTDGKIVKIGAVQRFERALSRDVTRRREFDSDPPGVTVELIPNPTRTLTLTIARAVLYKNTLLDEFGFNGIEDLIEANIPITIYEHRFDPDGNVETVEYVDCYFTAYPIAYDLTRDLLMIQTATLEAAKAVLHRPGVAI
jgi:hypothetical protein